MKKKEFEKLSKEAAREHNKIIVAALTDEPVRVEEWGEFVALDKNGNLVTGVSYQDCKKLLEYSNATIDRHSLSNERTLKAGEGAGNGPQVAAVLRSLTGE